MPGFGVRYSFTDLGPDTYFIPVIRYAISVAGRSHEAEHPASTDFAETEYWPIGALVPASLVSRITRARPLFE
jgi:hypothetical protein